jgi:hypothetical protein
LGDIRTHAEVTEYVSQQIASAYPRALQPDDFTCIELGNFLTDVSQFRDPPAHHRFREALQHGRLPGSAHIFSGFVLLDEWLLEMFGTRGIRGGAGFLSRLIERHGKLAEFFRRIAFAVCHTLFSTDGIVHAMPGGPTPAASFFARFRALAPADLDRIITQYFTQYWPHEHLDALPFDEFRIDGTQHRQLRSFQRGGRGLINYLEWYIQYLSEELTKLEYEWMRSLPSPNRQLAQDFVVRLGHLLHAIEDYYFHSNFTEIRQFQRLQQLHPNWGTNDPAHRFNVYANQSVDGTRYPRSPNRLHRLLNRRLRYPIYARGLELSSQTSEEADNLLYTGGFSSTDVMHTLGSAFEAMEQAVAEVDAIQAALPSPSAGARATIGERLRNTPLILVRLIFNQEARREMVRNPNLAEQHWQAHVRQLNARDYDRSIDQARTQGQLSPRAAAELHAAFEVDRRLQTSIPRLPGPGGTLIRLLEVIQEERDRSATESASLDANAGSIIDWASEDGASAERIGTHSLMAKDTPTKEPFRPEAVALAKHASASIALQLMSRVTVPTNDFSRGTDWDTVLRHYLRFPLGGSGRWEEFLISRLQQQPQSAQPDVSAVPDRANYSLLGPDLQPDKLAARRSGRTTNQLEEYYRSLELDYTPE